MRKLKKFFAVAATAAMTLAMSVSAFADQTITFHFQNANNWDPVGAWIYQGVGFDVNVTNAFVTNSKADGTVKQLWPGAKCTDEGNGWVTTSATFTDLTSGAVLIFNNFVADSEINDTTEEDDLEAIKASGIATTATATKEQTANISLNKKNVFKDGATPSDVWISYDGKTTTVSATAPDSYSTSGSTSGSTDTTSTSGSTSTDTTSTDTSSTGGTTSTDSSTPSGGSSAPSGGGSTTPTGTGTSSNTNAPTTGDTVAVSAIVLAAVAAIAVVATKKKVNA